MWRAAVLACVIVSAWPAVATPGEGPPADQVFRQFGLFGEWATDCAAPPSPDDPHVAISEPAPGLILEEHDIGPDNVINRYSVLTASRLSDTQLSVGVLLHPGMDDEERQSLTFEVRNDTRRTIFNQAEDGTVRVKDGIAQWNGSKTPLLHKCE